MAKSTGTGFKGGLGIPGMRPRKTKGLHPVMTLGVPRALLDRSRKAEKEEAPRREAVLV